MSPGVRLCPRGPVLVRGACEVVDEEGVAHDVTRPAVAVCVCSKSSIRSDGLDVARLCLEVVGAQLAPRGAALLQLGTGDQAEALSPEIEAADLHAVEVRAHDGGVVARLARSGVPDREPEPAPVRLAWRSDL